LFRSRQEGAEFRGQFLTRRIVTDPDRAKSALDIPDVGGIENGAGVISIRGHGALPPPAETGCAKWSGDRRFSCAQHLYTPDLNVA